MTRRMKRWTMRIAISTGVVMGLPSTVLADVRIVTREGSALQGDASNLPTAVRNSLGGAEPKTVTYWIGSDRTTRVGEDGTTIARLDRGEFYLLDRKNSTYRAMPLAHDRTSAAEAGAWKVVKSDETRQVGPWKATRHDMTVEMAGATMEVTLWVSDVGIRMNALRAFFDAFAERQGMGWMRALMELDGYPVRQEVKMGPILSWQEVVSIGEATAPPGTYDVPAGYTRR